MSVVVYAKEFREFRKINPIVNGEHTNLLVHAFTLGMLQDRQNDADPDPQHSD
jgi:hypothetical protein